MNLKKIKSYIRTFNFRSPVIFASIITFGFLLGVFFFNSHISINRDGSGYLFQANDYVNDIFGTDLTSTPFLAILIGFISKAASINLINAALLLNSFFVFTFTYTFIALIAQLVPQNKNIIFCSFLVLVSSTLLYDDYFQMIIRDSGMWVFLLLAIFNFIKYVEYKKNYHFFMYIFNILLAALFRPESLAYLLLIIPVLLNSKKNTKFNLYSILFFLFSITIIFLNDHYLIERLSEFFKRILQVNLLKPLPISTDNFWLSSLLEDFQLEFKFLFFIYVFLIKFITGLGIFTLVALASYFFLPSLKINKQINLFLILFITINCVTVFLNLLSTNVISTRYLMPSIIILYIYSCNGLVKIFDLKKDKPFNYIFIGLVIYASLSFFNILFDKQNFDKDFKTSEFIKSKQLNNDEIFTNNLRLKVYLNYFDNYEFVDVKKVFSKNQYDYIIVDKFENEHIENNYNYNLHEKIPNNKDAQNFIYKRK